MESWHTWQRKYILWRQSTDPRGATVVGLSSLHNLIMPKREKSFPFFHHTWAGMSSSSTTTKPFNRHMQFPFSKHRLCTPKYSVTRSQHSWAIRKGRTHMSYARQQRFPKSCPAQESTIHSKDMEATQQDSCLHTERKRPISIQQQIIGILCNLFLLLKIIRPSFPPTFM